MSLRPFEVGQQQKGARQIAKVTKIKDDEAGMMVEWNEGDTFKGKEVTLGQLLTWNGEEDTQTKRKVNPDTRNINSRRTIFTRDVKSKQPPVLSAGTKS
ncbi:hypothetical protein MXB_868 [Myxobolus squamalis]|nr:hypothetical protein MXB_868 [Myxobolus squamalis]